MVRLGWQLGADDGIDGAGQDSTESAKKRLYHRDDRDLIRGWVRVKPGQACFANKVLNTPVVFASWSAGEFVTHRISPRVAVM